LLSDNLENSVIQHLSGRIQVGSTEFCSFVEKTVFENNVHILGLYVPSVGGSCPAQNSEIFVTNLIMNGQTSTAK
jgi:hypothetical protein